MEPWKKFVSARIEKELILQHYFELRVEFKRLELSEEDLVAPPRYSHKMWQLKSIIGSNFNSLLKKINDYGFDVSSGELEKYLEPEFIKINHLTPLNDGN